MIAESLSEGLLDPEEHSRLTRALQIRNRVVADVAVPLPTSGPCRWPAPGSGPPSRRSKRPCAETGYSRFPVADADGSFIGYLHIKDVLALVDDPDAVVDLAEVRAAAAGVRVAAAARRAVAAAPRQQSPGARHRRRAGDARWWRWRTWSRTWSARCATGRTVSEMVLELRCSRNRVDATRADAPEPGRGASSDRTGRGLGGARRTRCGTSCSATTACGPGSCAAGTPVSASHSTARGGASRSSTARATTDAARSSR